MYRPLAFIVVAVAVGATVYWGVVRGRAGASGPVAAGPAGARVEDVDGITVVHLAGPPREKGRALGKALAVRIREELQRFLPEEPSMRDFVVGTCGERLAAFLPRQYREEIKGIAEGCGATFLEVLFLSTRFELSRFELANRSADLDGVGAIGPGPAAGRLFDGEIERDLVVVVHEDRDPPLVLVARPGMAGGLLGLAGETAAVLRPIRTDVEPTLDGLVWTLLLRQLLEDPPQGRDELAVEVTGPASVAMALPDGASGTLNLAIWGATWYPAGGARSLTTDEAITGRDGGMDEGHRDTAARTRVAEAAARLLAESPPDRTLVSIRTTEEGAVLTLARGGVRRESAIVAGR